MSRFNNNCKAVWGPHRPDTFPNGSSHRPNPNLVGNRRGNEGYNRQSGDDGDLETRIMDDIPNDEPVSTKLDRVLDKSEKFDLWKDEADRRFENLDPKLSRETEPPLGFDDEGEGELENFRGQRPVERGIRIGNNTGLREGPFDDRGRREDRNRVRAGWERTGSRQPRQSTGGYTRQFDRPTSCWDPPQRFHANSAGDKPQQVTMKPPRFDGSDATNWVSRVQYYFDHVMMPDAQRLHYAVMLLDPPASE